MKRKKIYIYTYKTVLTAFDRRSINVDEREKFYVLSCVHSMFRTFVSTLHILCGLCSLSFSLLFLSSHCFFFFSFFYIYIHILLSSLSLTKNPWKGKKKKSWSGRECHRRERNSNEALDKRFRLVFSKLYLLLRSKEKLLWILFSPTL